MKKRSFFRRTRLISQQKYYDFVITIKKAIHDLKMGKFVMVYDADGREEETDLVIASEFITPRDIKRLRTDGGGLICATVYYPLAEKLKLPFLAEMYAEISNNAHYEILKYLSPYDIPYDTKSSFSITINHRKTFTGISDNDRALTISEFAKLASLNKNGKSLREHFGKNFRSPGHIPLLKTAKNLLEERTGHTELATALMLLAGLTPSVTICEMLGSNGKSLSKNRAINYARKNNFVFLRGKEIIEAWKKWLR